MEANKPATKTATPRTKTVTTQVAIFHVGVELAGG
jgi:hypothetical protein